jgi:hypothetical protein
VKSAVVVDVIDTSPPEVKALLVVALSMRAPVPWTVMSRVAVIAVVPVPTLLKSPVLNEIEPSPYKQRLVWYMSAKHHVLGGARMMQCRV